MSYQEVIDRLNGKIGDTPLISLWRHYPGIDLDLTKLVDATIRDIKNYNSDLVKLSPHGRVPVVDLGCKISPGTEEHGSTGASSCIECSIKSINDWKEFISKYETVDPLDGHYGIQIKYVEKIKQKFSDKPIMMTIFSPTMVARKLSSNQMPFHYFEVNEDNENELQPFVNESLKLVSKITTEFASACVDAGADGIFAAVQEADTTLSFTNNQLIKLIKLNQSFFKSINRKSEFTVLHIHGQDVLFNEAIELLKPTSVNWHSQTSSTNLLQAHTKFKGGLLGGLNPEFLLENNLEDLNELLKHHKSSLDKLPLILAPGCVILQGTPDSVLENIVTKYR